MTLVYLAGAWLLGVVAGAVAGVIWWPGVAAIGVAGLAAGVLERRPSLALIGLLAAGLFVAGGTRYLDQRPSTAPHGIAVYNDGAPVRFRALVTGEPDVSGRSQRVQLETREVFRGGAWRATSGGVLLRTGQFPRYRYGDVLELRGELETPPVLPDFDYRDYLAQRGVVALLAYPDEARVIDTGEGNPALAALYDVRGRLGDALARALPEPQAALAQGIVLGQRAAIPDDLTADMNATGTSHLIAISGQNITLVTGLVISSLAWLIGRRQAALVALLAIAWYTALTGASPSIVRAAIMGGLFVLATLAGRPTSAATSIVLAAAIMTGLHPLVIRDVSFQLSFAAIAGLVYLSPALQARGAELLATRGIDANAGVAAFLLESTAVTLGAIAATLPLIALYFGRISLVAPFANLALVPAFPAIMVSAIVTAVAGVIWAPLGEATAWFSWALLTYMIDGARFFADLPLASLSVGGFGRWHAATAYLALVAGGWWLARWRPRTSTQAASYLPATKPLVQPAWLLAGGLAVAATIGWWTVAADASSGRLTVSVLDVSQGDAILVETPDGHHLLVDGGASGQLLAQRLGEELPFPERTLDLVALTHPQEDHLAGLVEALQRYEVRQVLATPREADTATYDTWRDLIQRQAVPYHEARAGERIELGGGTTLQVLGPDDETLAANDASLVLKLSWRDVSFLLAGDIEAGGEAELLRSHAGVSATVLKVPHHGSRTSSSAAFVEAVHPLVSVVSVGANNPFGHPAPEVIDRLDDGGVVLRTDRNGTVRLSTDGERLWVEPRR